ncbi:MAG: hypothetical protein Hens3KO_08040 [Henriciella sp.]
MKSLIIALACLGLVSCTISFPAPGSTEQQPTPSVDINSESALASLPASGLGPQTLLPGECGLFLWSQTDASKFIFFSKAISGAALVSQSEGPVELTQTGARGDIFGQFNTELSYLSTSGATVDLTIVPGEELLGGQRIESGMLTVVDLVGWVTKLPVLGVRACQPE